MNYSTSMLACVTLITVASQAAAHLLSPSPRPCPAGVQADGSINWNNLPASPLGAAVSATIPVAGISGLTATVQIPALTPAITLAGVKAVSSTDLFLPLGEKLTMVFSQPIKGISTSLRIQGRFTWSATISAYGAASEIGNVPASAQLTEDSYDFPSPGDEETVPLQIRSESASFGAVVIEFAASIYEYGGFDVVNLRIESGSGPDDSKAVPTDGLKQWLRADAIYDPFTFSLSMTTWPDQSGNHADASSPVGIQPAKADGPNCTAALQFNGTPLSANLPIDGWTAMTVFLVSSSADDTAGWYENQPLFWGETALWGTTFISPSQSNVFFRFGTTQVNNQPIYARPVTVGGDYTLTSAVHDDNVDRLYLNGVLALRQAGKLAALSGVSSTEWIGKGLNGTLFNGSIGEILIYNRALNDNERNRVEHYLMKKFGLF